jgi:hypothetical protein
MTENNNLQKLFDVCPFYVSSNFERQNFQAQPGPGHARYLINTINKIRKINSDFDKNNLTVYETNCLLEEKAALMSILENEDIDELELTIKNWEFNEREYWPNYLGKQAAIEILTIGHTTVETMTRMAQLPEDLYVKATQICVKLANTIKQVTQEAEEEMGYTNTPFEAEPADSNKKLILKKVK